MATLKATTEVRVLGTFASPGDLANTQQILNRQDEKTYTSGTGVNQVDVQWQDQRTLVATSEKLDLASGGAGGVVVTSPFGGELTFATVKVLYIKNTSTADNLTIGGGTTTWATPFGDATDKVVIPPEGVFLLTAPLDGMAVTSGTADQLTIDAGAATITYDVIIQGTSA